MVALGYKRLKVGDVRQPQDEYHRKDSKDYSPKFRGLTADLEAWQSVSLVGHAILSSDAMIFEYRRPLL